MVSRYARFATRSAGAAAGCGRGHGHRVLGENGRNCRFPVSCRSRDYRRPGLPARHSRHRREQALLALTRASSCAIASMRRWQIAGCSCDPSPSKQRRANRRSCRRSGSRHRCVSSLANMNGAGMMRFRKNENLGGFYKNAAHFQGTIRFGHRRCAFSKTPCSNGLLYLVQRRQVSPAPGGGNLDPKGDFRAKDRLSLPQGRARGRSAYHRASDDGENGMVWNPLDMHGRVSNGSSSDVSVRSWNPQPDRRTMTVSGSERSKQMNLGPDRG